MTPMDRIRVQDSFEAVKPIADEAARLFMVACLKLLRK